ncbi:hypothetical protein PMAYCL1PPCAC_14806, partial [Pristionchus mayeri]
IDFCSYSMPRFALTVLILATFTIAVQAIKFSAELEKACGEQLLATLAKETDDEMRTIMNKLIDSVQKGDFEGTQAIISKLTEHQKQYAADHYWIDACLPLKSCLECPIEL